MYRTIVVDPPWEHERTGVTFTDKSSGRFRSHGTPYGSMSLAEITALPVRDLSDNIGEDAHLYLWATHRYLPDAFGIARAWGFHYSTTIVWCKPARGFSLGGTWPTNAEFVLFCRRPGHTLRPDALKVTSRLADAANAAGISRHEVDEAMGTSDMAGWWLSRIESRCAVPTDTQWPCLRDLLGIGHELDEAVKEINAAKGTSHKHTAKTTSCWHEWNRGEHSAKPEGFLDLVEQVSPGPYLEMFARRARFGWDYWGDESLGTAELSA